MYHNFFLYLCLLKDLAQSAIMVQSDDGIGLALVGLYLYLTGSHAEDHNSLLILIGH